MADPLEIGKELLNSTKVIHSERAQRRGRVSLYACTFATVFCLLLTSSVNLHDLASLSNARTALTCLKRDLDDLPSGRRLQAAQASLLLDITTDEIAAIETLRRSGFFDGIADSSLSLAQLVQQFAVDSQVVIREFHWDILKDVAAMIPLDVAKSKMSFARMVDSIIALEGRYGLGANSRYPWLYEVLPFVRQRITELNLLNGTLVGDGFEKLVDDQMRRRNQFGAVIKEFSRLEKPDCRGNLHDGLRPRELSYCGVLGLPYLSLDSAALTQVLSLPSIVNSIPYYADDPALVKEDVTIVGRSLGKALGTVGARINEEGKRLIGSLHRVSVFGVDLPIPIGILTFLLPVPILALERLLRLFGAQERRSLVSVIALEREMSEQVGLRLESSPSEVLLTDSRLSQGIASLLLICAAVLVFAYTVLLSWFGAGNYGWIVVILDVLFGGAVLVLSRRMYRRLVDSRALMPQEGLNG